MHTFFLIKMCVVYIFALVLVVVFK